MRPTSNFDFEVQFRILEFAHPSVQQHNRQRENWGRESLIQRRHCTGQSSVSSWRNQRDGREREREGRRARAKNHYNDEIREPGRARWQTAADVGSHNSQLKNTHSTFDGSGGGGRALRWRWRVSDKQNTRHPCAGEVWVTPGRVVIREGRGP